MWLSVPCFECPSRENLAPVGVHRIQGKWGYPCLTLNVLLCIAVCSAQDALLGIVSIYECPTPYSSMARKCGYSEHGIRSRTCGYTELSEEWPSYLECLTPNIGTIRSSASYKILLRLEQSKFITPFFYNWKGTNKISNEERCRAILSCQNDDITPQVGLLCLKIQEAFEEQALWNYHY